MISTLSSKATSFIVYSDCGAAVCQRAHELWTIRSGQCVPNSPADRFVCVLGRVKHRSHSDRELAYSIPLSRSVALYTSLCGSQVEWRKGKSRAGGVKEWGRGKNDVGRGSWLRGGFNQGAWQLLLRSGMPGHCSILCSGKFLS